MQVCVPGRIPGRVLGMDLARLAWVLKALIPDAWTAINLDGGASSQCVHKRADTSIVQVSPNAHAVKLVGNFLGFYKPALMEQGTRQRGVSIPSPGNQMT